VTLQQQLGQAAEQAALDYLQHQGLRLVQRNFQCRYGELDLIMRDGQILVFVEVRLRHNAQFGGALASVTTRKQHKLIQAARCFLNQYPESLACRFDVVAFDGKVNPSPQWIRHAFSC
jgi:putative endonuclease